MVLRTEPVVSVIIPCYNDGLYLTEALASVEGCPDDVYEIIIVDDGSTEPTTLEVLAQLKSDGYRILEKEHGGPSSARNVGIRESRGKYILPLDADNKIKPDYITQGLKILEESPDVSVAYGDCIRFGAGDDERVYVSDFSMERLSCGNFIDTCAIYRRGLWVECGGYDEGLVGWEDWEFWIHAALVGRKFRHIPEVMFYYRIKKESVNRRCSDPEVARGIVEHILKKHPGFSYTPP